MSSERERAEREREKERKREREDSLWTTRREMLDFMMFSEAGPRKNGQYIFPWSFGIQMLHTGADERPAARDDMN